MDVEKLKQKILDLAIRGKLVPQDQDDEPASVLIEKIRAEKEKLVKEGKIKASKEESYIYKGSDNLYYENGKRFSFIEPLDVAMNFVWLRGSMFLYAMESKKPTGDSFQYIDIDSIDNSKNTITRKIIPTSKAPSRASRKVFKESSVFSMVRPYLRNVAFVGLENADAIASTGFYVCTPMPFVLPEYLFMLLKSDYVVNGLNFFMKGDNSPSINGSNIENFLFPIPSLSYQQKALNTYSRIEKLLNTLNENIDDLKSYVESAKYKILDSIFGENSSYKSYYTKMKKFEEDVEILDNKRVPINSSERQNRLSKATKTYPYYGATGQVGLIDDFLLDGEYILLGEDGAPFLDRHAEKAYIVSGKIWVNNHAHILKSKSHNRFLLHYLNWINYQPFVSGTTRLKLNQQMMKRIQIPDYPLHVKVKISNLIDEAFRILEKLTN